MAVQEGAGFRTGVFCVLGLMPIWETREAVLLGTVRPGPYTARTTYDPQSTGPIQER